MSRDKLNLGKIFTVIIFTGLITLSSCETPYPYTEYELIYLGSKSGLTSSSSDQEFRNGLNEVLQNWAANNTSTNEVIINGVSYELTNFQEVTGALPKSLWDVFWQKLGEYNYSVGTCWVFTEATIPSKGDIGTAYIIYTIVTQDELQSAGEVLYIGLKCNLIPKSSSRIKSTKIQQLNEVEKMHELFKNSEKPEFQ
jgi:hypothetical protein